MDHLKLVPKQDQGCLMLLTLIPIHLVTRKATSQPCCTYPGAYFQFKTNRPTKPYVPNQAYSHFINQIEQQANKHVQQC